MPTFPYLQHLPAVFSARELMPSYARELCPHIGRHSKLMRSRSVKATCCAARQGSDEAVLVVGAGIAGLATAAALHKVLAALQPEAILQYVGMLSCSRTLYFSSQVTPASVSV